MSTEINFTGSLNDEDTRVALNLPRKTLTVSTGAALTSGVTAVTEAESCSYNALLDLDRKRLLHQASLVVLPSTYGEGRLFSQKPTYNTNGTFTVTRATTATRVNSAGLVDLVPYNLVTYSEMFENAAWIKENATISANATTAPNGTLTADKLQEDNTTNKHDFYFDGIGGNGIASTIGQTYTISIYAKAAERNFMQIAFGTGQVSGNPRVNFNISNGTITAVDSGITATIESVGNGWYRCNSSVTAATGFLTFITQTQTSGTAARFATYLGTTGSGLYLWGAQLVAGTSARDYLRTETRLNIPRIDYSLGGCPNILLEPQRTNLALYSENFADVTWAKLRTTVTQNTTNSPDNTLNADTIEVSSSGQAYFSQGVTTTVGTVNVSIYCKYINQQFLQIYSSSSGQAYANFDILNGLAGSNGTSASNVVITPAANGFYRISVALVVPAAAINIRFAFVASSTSVYNPPDGVAGRQFYAWGAAIETGTTGTAAYATSYIPTTTASVTRNTDTINRSNIFTNGLITAAGGTWFVELRNNVPLVADDAVRNLWLGPNQAGPLTNGTLLFRQGGGTTRIQIWKYTSSVATNLYQTLTNTSKIAIKWNGSTADVFENGVKVVSATAFPHNNMEFISALGGRILNINSIALYTTPLSDTECINLTTL